jgi:nucleoside-diphosphate-sugar epimerase
VRVLITGGAGYLGSTLAPLLLSAGYKVRVLDRLAYGGESLLGVWAHPNFEFLRGDLRDREKLLEAVADCEAVVHLAAIVGDPACAREPKLARAVNLESSMELIDQSRKSGVQRFVFASTCSNYGKMKDPNHFVDEHSELRPVSLYAETKVAVERFLLESAGSDAWCPTPLRFATVFGVSPRMRFDLTVNEFTMELITRKRLIVFGEQFWRPYVHVLDAARAIALVLNSPVRAISGRVFNVGSTDQNLQKQQIVELIRPMTPDAVVEYVHKNEDPRDYRVSFQRILTELGYETTRSVEDGIMEVAKLVRAGAIPNLADSRYRN